MNIRDYYASRAVRSRMTEFLGATTLERATAAYVTATPPSRELPRDLSPPVELPRWLDAGEDVSRSLLDRESLIAHLDIDYVHFDAPGTAYEDPERMFEVVRPVASAVRDVLGTFGVDPLGVVSGRGYHFVWRILRTSPTFRVLVDLGRVHPALAERYAERRTPREEPVPPDLGSAFSGLGMVIEYLAQLVVAAASPQTPVPITLTAIEVGPGSRGREVVALDVSEYADPLHTRVIRIPFSTYQKPQWHRTLLGDELVDRLPTMVSVAVDGATESDALVAMRDLGLARELASSARTPIPDASEATWRLVTAYIRSTLHAFHLDFYDQPHAIGQDLDPTRLDLPPCVTTLLDHPNDLLLRPALIQHLVRSLMAVGWHPRRIADLLRTKYEEDHRWGSLWRDYDRESRADFYTRLFGGLVATGLDEGVDFNCRSAQEKGTCSFTGCGYDLTLLRPQLLARKSTPPPHAISPLRVLDRVLLPG